VRVEALTDRQHKALPPGLKTR